MSKKISDYTAITTLASTDLMEWSKDLGAGSFGSRKITYSNLLAQINAGITITGAALTKTDDTNVTLTLGGTPSTALLNGVSLTIGWTGNLSALRGGTGRSSWTAGSLVYSPTTNNLGQLLAGSSGDVLTMSGGLPSWQPAINLSTTDLTSTSNNRTYSLLGSTPSQSFSFLKGGGGVLSKYYGSGQIDFGSTSSYVQPNIYLNSALADQMVVYSGSNGYIYINPASLVTSHVGGSGNRLDLYASSGSLEAGGANAGFYIKNGSGTVRGGFIMSSLSSLLYMNDSLGTRVFHLDSGNGYGAVVGNMSIGLNYNTSPSARLHIKASGTTSSTASILAQDSSANRLFEVRDDGYSISKLNTSAISSADLNNGEYSAHVNEGSNLLTFTVKYSSGTVKTGTIALI